MPKIYITGSCGCGKSTFAKRLAKKLNIEHLDLDDVSWKKSPDRKNFMIKRTDEEKQKYICSFLSTYSDWIVEGAQGKDWLLPFVESCTQVIVIQVHPVVRDMRIIRRSVKRKLGIEKSNHKENFLGICRLLRYNHRYDKDILPQILEKFISRNKSVHKVSRKKHLSG